MPVLRRLSYRQVYVLLALLLAAAMVASASIGAFVFSPSQMALFVGEAIGLLPKRLDDALDRNVFFLLVFGSTAALSPLGTAGVPILAFACSFAATILVYRLSTSFGRTDVFTLLLAGIALNAMCGAGTGLLSYIARDPQARNITFWNLGTFTTADWRGALLVGAAFAICFLLALRHGKNLNALMLGEDDAAYTGVNPEKLILRLIVINTVMVSVATAWWA
jgi:iron complex transport system permease protein